MLKIQFQPRIKLYRSRKVEKLVAPISSYGVYNMSALNAFSGIQQAQKVDPAITQDLKDAENVAKTATSLSDRVEPIRPNAKDDGTWAYVQSQNMGLPQMLDIEGMDTSDNKIVIDLKGFNIPDSEVFKAPAEVQEKHDKEIEEEVIADVAQEYMMRFQEFADDFIKMTSVDENKEDKKENFDNFYANQFFGLNSYSQSVKAYENYSDVATSFVA